MKVYEGERKMTKDNFLVGEFELFGIESAPRGVAQIEITFSVDVNGIINVTALDLKNTENKKTISINSNKGRLSQEKIKELIEEAQHSELHDKIEREKKQFFYEIDDLCSNIKININNEDFKLKDADKEMIMTDINKIFGWLEEKNYNERDKKDYIRILENLKKKYGTLILRVTDEYNDVKAVSDGKVEATTVFENEKDEEQYYEEIENDELGIKEKDDDIKNEIKRLRDLLVNLCYSIFDIISDHYFNIEKDHMNELKEYIDDILLWTYVKEKISIIEYKQKIDEVNKVCNDIVERYNQKEIFRDECDKSKYSSKRTEFEQTCYALMGSIMSNILALHEDNIKRLKSLLEENLDWLVEIDLSDDDIAESEFQRRLDLLNELCEYLYKSMITIQPDINIINETSEENGTSLFDL